jgi:hypothetical protein
MSISIHISELEDVRLIGTSNIAEGLVQLKYNNMWGTVCSQIWSEEESFVVCKQLGYSSANSSKNTIRISVEAEQERVWIGDVACLGTESALSECFLDFPSVLQDMEKCSKEWQVKVACDLKVRIRDNRPYYGIVQVYYKERWSYICPENWGDSEATVACRQLGYSFGYPISREWFDKADVLPRDIMTKKIKCMGNEIGLQRCQIYSGLGHNLCNGMTSIKQYHLLHMASVRCGKLLSLFQMNCSRRAYFLALLRIKTVCI